jgi:hypothetical protein
VTDRDMTRIQDGIVRQLQQALATQDDPRNSNDAMCPGWDQYPGGEVR